MKNIILKYRTRLLDWTIRVSCLILSVGYCHQYIRHMIQAQDFRRGYFASVSAIAIALICNGGLWFVTSPVSKQHRAIALIALVPSITISPMIAYSYLGEWSSLVYGLSLAAIVRLFMKDTYEKHPYRKLSYIPIAKARGFTTTSGKFNIFGQEFSIHSTAKAIA